MSGATIGVSGDRVGDGGSVAPRPRLRMRDRPRLIWRAISQARAHHATHLAQAVAFNLFLVIPSVLLLALGVFTKVGSPGSVETLLTHLEGVVPNSVIDLVRQSLNQVLTANQGGTLIVVGALLALWALSGAMQTVMWSLNLAHGAEETRGFLHGRVVSVLMGLFALLAIAAMVVALVLGPTVSHWIDGNLGSQAGDIAGWAWSIGRWPAAALVLLVSFAVVLHLGPDVPGRRFRLITTGAVIATVVWLVASAGFAFYANNFSSYNKSWGSLAAVIITLTWLWLSALALLLGAEVDAEVERVCRGDDVPAQAGAE
jgi:membrane protein